MSLRVGVIADTHGVLRPEAAELLCGSDHIVHAGDIGSAELLDALRRIAPTTVVRGNNDTEDWARHIPDSVLLELGDLGLYVVHDRAAFRGRSPPHGADVIVTGHSHKPALDEWQGRLMLNPGSAGSRRFKLPVALADLRIEGRRVAVRVIDLLSRRLLLERTHTFS